MDSDLIYCVVLYTENKTLKRSQFFKKVKVINDLEKANN
jgi:hypothetical protein